MSFSDDWAKAGPAADAISAQMGFDKPWWERALDSPMLFMAQPGASTLANYGPLALQAAITGGEKMGLFSSIVKGVKSLVTTAKAAAPLAFDFMPGGNYLKMGYNVLEGLTASKSVGAVERASATAASRAYTVEEIMAATERAGYGAVGAGKAAEAAVGIRVRPGVGKVLKVGAGSLAAGLGIGITQVAADKLSERFSFRKNTPQDFSVKLSDIGPLDVRVLGAEGEYYGAASRPQRKPKKRKAAKRKKRTTRKKTSSRSAAQKRALKKAQAALKRYRKRHAA